MNSQCRRFAWAASVAVLLALPGAPVAAQPAPRPAPQGPPPARQAALPELVTEANLSRDMMKAVYDAAKVPAALDGGGNLIVSLPQVKVFVLPGKDSVRLMASYDFAPRATWQEKLDLANRINDEYIMVRALLPETRPNTLSVDYYVVIGAGISRATLVAITKRFGDVVVEAIGATDTDRLIK